MNAGAALTLVSLALLLFFEKRRHPTGRMVAKTLASIGFLVTAFAIDTYSRYAVGIKVALVLSAIGDVALLFKDRKSGFLLGLGSFLLAHLAFAAAFLFRGQNISYATVAALVSAGLAVPVLLWLKPHVEKRKLMVPVTAYVLALSAMVALAFGTFGRRPETAIPNAAISFWLSDLAVANEVFVKSEFRNKAWGLPLYYVAQLLFAFTLSSNG